MSKGRVTHARSDGIHVMCYAGRVDYMLAPAIKRFAEEQLGDGDVRGWIFDLSQAEVLDSTNLGLLARIAERAHAAGCKRCVIVSPREDINCVLRSMAFDELFELVTTPPADAVLGADSEIDRAAASAQELGQIMLDAHRTLMAMSETGRVQFQDVVACMEAELTGREPAKPS